MDEPKRIEELTRDAYQQGLRRGRLDVQPNRREAT